MKVLNFKNMKPFDENKIFKAYERRTSFGVILTKIELMPKKIIPAHSVDVFSLFFVLKGKVEITAEGNTFKLSEGDSLEIPRHSKRSITNLEDGESEILVIKYK